MFFKKMYFITFKKTFFHEKYFFYKQRVTDLKVM